MGTPRVNVRLHHVHPSSEDPDGTLFIAGMAALGRLRAGSDDAAAVARDLEALSKAAHYVSAQSRVAELEDGAEVALRALRAHADNEDVQRCGWLAMCFFLEDKASLRRAVMAGGTDDALARLRACPHDDKPIIQATAGFLAAAARNPDARIFVTRALEEGAIEAVVAFMRANAADAHLQSLGCYTLFRLIKAVPEEAVKLRAGAAGVVELAVEALKAHASSSAFAFKPQAGLGVILECAMDCEENIARCIAADSHKVTLTVLRTEMAQPEVAAACCSFLNSLCLIRGKTVDTVNAVIGAGGFEAVLAAMRARPADAELQRSGCLALHSMCCPAAYGQALSAATMRVVVAALQAHGKIDKIALAICRCMGSLLSLTPHRDALDAAASGMEAVLTVMRTHAATVETQVICCWVLGQLCTMLVDCAPRAIAAGAVELAMAALRKHEAHPQLQYRAYALLAVLIGHDAAAARRAISSGVLLLRCMCDTEAHVAAARTSVLDAIARVEAQADAAAAALLAEEEAGPAATKSKRKGKGKNKAKPAAAGAEAAAGSAEGAAAGVSAESHAAGSAGGTAEAATASASAEAVPQLQLSAAAERRRRRAATKAARRGAAAASGSKQRAGGEVAAAASSDSEGEQVDASGASADAGMPAANAAAGGGSAAVAAASAASGSADVAAPATREPLLATLFPWPPPTPATSAAAPPPPVAAMPLSLQQQRAPEQADARRVTALEAQVAALAAANAKLEAERTCVICLDALRCTALLPCRHVPLCGSPACAAMLGAPPLCPLCREAVTDTMQLFL